MLHSVGSCKYDSGNPRLRLEVLYSSAAGSRRFILPSLTRLVILF